MVLGNVREQRQSLKGSCERREHERKSEHHEQGAVGAGAGSRSEGSVSEEWAVGAGAGSRSEGSVSEEWAVGAGSSGSRSREQGAGAGAGV